MKKRKLKKGVIKFLIITFMVMSFIHIWKNIDVVSKDELGNTCNGTIIKVCG